MDRITAIRESLRVFVCGLIGLLPVIGLAPAIYALVLRGRLRARYGKQWNPASAYLNLGVVLAAVGLIYSFLILVVAIYEATC